MKRFWIVVLTVVLTMGLFASNAYAAGRTWTGDGEEAIGPVKLSHGLAVFNFSSGETESNVIVWLEKTNGSRVELLVNTIGTHGGSRAVHIPRTGKYYLSIACDTSWKLSVKQPRPRSASKSRSFRGSGAAASKQFQLNRGAYRFKWDSSSEGNFIIWLLNKRGDRVDLICNKIGATRGSRRVRVPRTGVYIMDIQADDVWNVRVRR